MLVSMENKILNLGFLCFLCFLLMPQPSEAEDVNHPLYKLNSALLENDNNTAKHILVTDLKGETDLVSRFGEFAACKSLDIASIHGSLEIMNLILRMGVNMECSILERSGDTPLMNAYMAGKRETVQYMVEEGADINFPNNFGATTFWVAVTEGDTDYVTFFLKHDANLEQSGRFPDPLKEENGIVRNVTPLMMASARGHIEIVELLIKNGAFIGIQDIYGRDAMHYAKSSGHKDIADLLRIEIKRLQ